VLKEARLQRDREFAAMKQVTGSAPKGEGAAMFFMGLEEGWATIRSVYEAEHGHEAKSIDDRTRFTRDYFATRLPEDARIRITNQYNADLAQRMADHRELIKMSDDGLIGLRLSAAERLPYVPYYTAVSCLLTVFQEDASNL
jgi:hypothetical protein